MPAKEFKKVCKCENCGNEAEMEITCSLPDETPPAAATATAPSAAPEPPSPRKVKGQVTCTQCGNEADMWVDL